ncbi:hypothetical protein PF010_g2124 [Phytophthora fragariae]|uniref:Uncharacterized protein n=1 Tax=Phytophthora fragariae TaxID=53985 RepID=A0A6G0LYY8_9STRA|nr:hypothetical protein PF010_g2124 [Phytophthora fragariae]KAE9252503.1 hypothetical protein PF004_g1926 [Phytophthora fragariae]KAE9359424.1 hypothetical protein PF008_g2253 [Phytophthora fragariae]
MLHSFSRLNRYPVARGSNGGSSGGGSVTEPLRQDSMVGVHWHLEKSATSLFSSIMGLLPISRAFIKAPPLVPLQHARANAGHGPRLQFNHKLAAVP